MIDDQRVQDYYQGIACSLLHCCTRTRMGAGQGNSEMAVWGHQSIANGQSADRHPSALQ